MTFVNHFRKQKVQMFLATKYKHVGGRVVGQVVGRVVGFFHVVHE